MANDDFFFGTKDLEANEELDFVVWAEDNGWECRKIAYVGRRGCPDRLLVGYGQILLLEMKRPSARKIRGGGLSTLQDKEFARFKEIGVTIPVFYTAKDAIEYLQGFML